MAHTSGPWTTDGDEVFAVDTSLTPNRICVATVSHDIEEDLANANLMAAAPDLLHALKAASWELILPSDSHLRLLIDAAIAKAEGV